MEAGYGSNPRLVVTAYIVAYRYVWEIWSGVFDLNDKYGCGVLAKSINMAIKIAIFKLKNTDLGANFG